MPSEKFTFKLKTVNNMGVLVSSRKHSLNNEVDSQHTIAKGAAAII